MNRTLEIFKKRANECYKENNNGKDCLVESTNTIRLHPEFCKYCKKLKKAKSPGNLKAKPIKKKKGEMNRTSEFFKKKVNDCYMKPEIILKKSPGKELEKPDYSIKKFKYPYLLASYPFFKDSSKFYKLLVKHTIDEEESLENLAFGMYGEYRIISYRNPKLIDVKVSLADIYLSDYFKSRIYEVSIKEFLELLKLESTGYYRSEILKSQHYLKNTTFITPIVNFNTGEKSGIHEWSILSEFKFYDKQRRKYYYKIHLGDTIYKDIHNNKYTLLELEKVLNLSRIALNLFLYLTIQSPSKLSKYPKNFEDLKIAIGITDKHITQARKTFEKAWSDVKSKGLLKGYRHSEVFISKKDNREKMKFSKQRDLIP